MNKFRRKPVEIEAIQYITGEQDRAFAADAIAGNIRYSADGTMLIRTLEGGMIARSGDWIIRGVKGELSRCRPDVFTATYDAVKS